VKEISIGLLELEMADLERFWRKSPLGPLGVNAQFLILILLYMFPTLPNNLVLIEQKNLQKNAKCNVKLQTCSPLCTLLQ
jgi:hypothetical protein